MMDRWAVDTWERRSQLLRLYRKLIFPVLRDLTVMKVSGFPRSLILFHCTVAVQMWGRGWKTGPSTCISAGPVFQRPDSQIFDWVCVGERP